MRAIRGEPVEVWLRHGKPARFVWRGRMYTVLFVRDRRAVPGTDAGTEAGTADGRECWLVEATPVRAVPAATYELCHDAPADRWTLSRS
jgi:hypothetical protein